LTFKQLEEIDRFEHNLILEQLEEIGNIVYGDEDDDLPLCYRTKSMFLPNFLKLRLNENLELKISRQRLMVTDEELTSQHALSYHFMDQEGRSLRDNQDQVQD
jgi:hypothetical protein